MAPVFCGEDGVNENFGERLGHRRRMGNPAHGFNPFRVDNVYINKPRVARGLATLGCMISSRWDERIELLILGFLISSPIA
jgi:hypothetical protein